MIRLSNSGVQSLELVTTQAGASFGCSYSDESASQYTGGSGYGLVPTATTTTIVAAPGAGLIRDVDNINVKNTFAGQHTILLQVNSSGTLVPMVSATLETGENLNYTHGSGWQVKDATGATKVTNGPLISVFGEVGVVTGTDYMALNTTTPNDTRGVGSFYWNDTDGTIDLKLKGGNVTLQVGQEQLIRIRNTTGATLPNGAVVYLSGAQSDRVTAALAVSTSALASDRTVGVMTEAVANNAEGYVNVSGLVRDLDTSVWAEGDLLYISSVAGVMTNVMPPAPQHAVVVGIVVRDHPTAGMIFVSVRNGASLADLHDVLITTPTGDQALIYDAVNGYWVNSKGFSGKTDMTGFPVDSSGNYLCTLAYNETTRTVTITPTGASFDVFSVGTKYTKVGAQSIAHSAVGASQFVYYDETGTLVTTTSPWDLLKHAPVCYIFQDVTNSRRIPFEERHHAGRDLYWHRNQHAAEGTKATGSGFQVTGYTLNTGTDAACTFAISSGRVEDEDIRVDTQVLPDNGPYTILERVGASGEWQFTRTNTVPFLRSGTNTQYNQNTGATWQRTTIANTEYVNYYIFGLTALPTGDITPAPTTTQQYVMIPGQAKYTSAALASAETPASLAWGSAPFQEMVPLYKVTLQYLSAAGGSTRIIELTRVVGTSVSVTAAAQTDHGALTGLSDLDHPASAIINTPSGNLVATDVQAALNELQSDVDLRELAANVPGDVRGTLLAGIDVVTSAVISAVDTVLTGLGKLQAQITSYAAAALTLTNKTIALGSNTVSGTKSQFDVACSDGNFLYDNQTNTITKDLIISVTENTNPALRITQLGTGHALLVEDSANPDNTPFIITQTGAAILGTTADDGVNKLQVNGTAYVATSLGVGAASARGLLDLNTVRQVKLYWGTAGTIGETQQQAGDYIANNLYVSAEAAGTITYTKTTGDNGNAIIQDFVRGITFYTGVTGASTTTGTLNSFERGRFSGGGNLLLGTTTDDGVNKLQVTGSAGITGNAFFKSGTTTNDAGVIITNVANAIATSRYTAIFLDPNGANAGGIDYTLLRMYGSGEFEINNQLAAGFITLKTNALERARVTASGNLLIGTTTDDGVNKLQVNGTAKVNGLAFPATQVASADPNTLDDYEEGTWTPTQGAGLTLVGAFASSGTYTKVGRLLFLSGIISGATSVAVTAGQVMVGGMPFNAGVAAGGTAMNATATASSVLSSVAGSGNIYSAGAIAATASITFSLVVSV